ncbi:MAG: dihydrolipoamide acetyltransferase family protein [Nitriliruptoraceae bacterium]
MSDIKDFTLPDLGEGLEDGEIVRWHVEVGDVIGLNDAVAEVETAKAVVDVPSPYAGQIVERHGEIGETLQVGALLVRIDTSAATDGGGGQGEEAEVRASSGLDADEEPQPLVGYGQQEAAPRRRRRSSGPSHDPDSLVQAPARPLAKPPVRKLAKDLGVDLAAIAPGSGPQGSVTREDVRAAEEARTEPRAGARGQRPAAQAADASVEAASSGEKAIPGFRGRRPGEIERIRGVRKRIVEKMETSRREIPSASCSRDADLTELFVLRERLTEQARHEGLDLKITPLALILRATVVALRRYPTLNARIERPDDGSDPGQIHLLEHINLGVAADTDRGLVVPNIKDAHHRSTAGLASALADLATRARDGSLTPNEVTGGTFTVNNYGAFGNDDGDPIINHPEVGILGIGAIRERPWVVRNEHGDQQLAIRRVGRFTLAFDHRVCDGGEAGRFVTEVADLCEQPARLLLHL